MGWYQGFTGRGRPCASEYLCKVLRPPVEESFKPFLQWKSRPHLECVAHFALSDGNLSTKVRQFQAFEPLYKKPWNYRYNSEQMEEATSPVTAKFHRPEMSLFC